MSTINAMRLLESEVDERIRYNAKKRAHDKTWTTLLKLGSVSLAGVVTVLVGLQGENFDQHLLRNYALAFGVLITVTNAFDAIFDFKALWINRTITLSRLYALKLDMQFETAKAEPEEPSKEIIESFRKRFGDILQDDLREWTKMRSEVASNSPPEEVIANPKLADPSRQ